jgi:hypothetical protein
MTDDGLNPSSVGVQLARLIGITVQTGTALLRLLPLEHGLLLGLFTTAQ